MHSSPEMDLAVLTQRSGRALKRKGEGKGG